MTQQSYYMDYGRTPKLWPAKRAGGGGGGDSTTDSRFYANNSKTINGIGQNVQARNLGMLIIYFLDKR